MDAGACLPAASTCALSHSQRCIGRDSRCWTGWTLEAIWCVYECLADACLAPDDQRASPRLHTYIDEEPNTGLPPRYQHVPVAGSKNPEETYLALALEAALLGLGMQRMLPSGLYAQERYCKQEERLISQLQRVEGEAAGGVCARVARALLAGGPASCLGTKLHPRSAPAHTFARFLFLALLPNDPDLAYRVGLRAMRLPMVEEAYALDGGGAAAGGAGAWHTLQHAEQQQAALASALLGAARGTPARLRAALAAAQRHVRSAAQLFRLAQDALRHAAPPDAPYHHRDLLAAAFELGLQVLRMTLSAVNWRRREMVRWLVTCATELGLDALLSIMQNWYELFTPTEATGPVAAAAMSHATALRLGLSFEQQEKLSATARTLALQCAAKDPPGCALSALSVCEGSAGAFEAACAAVGGAAARGALASSQLFAVARYMEQRGQPARAMRLATLAMRNLHLHYNQLFAVARDMEQRGQPARAMRLATLAMRNLHLHYNQVRRTRTLTHTRARVQPAVRRGALHGAARAAGARHAPRHARHAQPAPALQPGAPHTHSYTHARSRPASCSPWRATWSSAGSRRAPCASPRSPCATCTCTTTRCAAHALLHTRALASSQLFAVARYMEQRGQPARAMRLATLAMRNLHLHYNQVRRTRTLTHTRARVQPAVRRGALHGAARAAGARHAPRHARHAQPAPALQPGAPHTHSYTHARSRPASCSPWRATWSSAGSRRAPCASPRSPCATCTCTTTRCAAHALLHTRALASSQLFAVARYMEQRGQPARAMRLATLAMRNLHLHYNQVRRTRTLTHTRARVQPAVRRGALHGAARAAGARHAPRHARHAQPAPALQPGAPHTHSYTHARSRPASCSPWRATWSSAGSRRAPCASPRSPCATCTCTTTRCAAHALLHTRALASSQLFAVARYMEQRGQPARAMRLATLAMRNLHLHYNQVRRTRTLTHTRARVQPAVRRGALHGAARAAGARHAPRHARHAQPAPALQPGAPHTHSYTHARSRPASCSPWRATWSSAGSRRAPCASPRSPCATCTCTTTRCAAHALLHTRALASSQLFAVARYMEQRGQPARAMRLATIAMRNLHLHYNQVRRTRTLTHTRARVQPAVRRGALHGAARATGARHAPRHARHAQPAPALQPGAPHTHSYTHARSRPASCSPWRATWSSAGSRRAPCASPRSPCATCTCTTTRCAAHALLHTRALASSQLFAVARYMEQRGQPARAMRLATLAMRNLHLHYNQVRRTRTLTHTRARVQPAVRRGALHGAARAAGARHAPRHDRHAQPAPALQPGAPHTHSYTHARSRPASCSPWRATWSSAGSRRAPCASPRSPCATCTCTTTRCAAHALLHTRALASSQLFAVARYMEQRGQPARAMRLATLAMRNLHLHYNQVRRTRTLTHTRARVQPAVRRGALHGAARAAGARHAPRHARHAQPAPALQPGAPHTHSYTHARSRPASCSPWRATWSSAGSRRAPCASPRSPCATCTCTTTRCAAHALLHTRALASSQLFAVARYMEQRGQPARAMRLATLAMRNLHLHYNQVRRTRTLTHTRARVQPAVRRGALHGAARAAGARHAPRHARHAQPAPALQPGAPHTHSYTHARSRPASCSPWRATWSSAGSRRAPCASPRSPCATCTCTTTRCAAHALLHTRALASSQLFAVARYMEQRGQPARAMRLATLAMRNLHLHYNQVRRTRTLTHTRARVQPAVRRGALHGAARAAGARHAPRHARHAQPAPALQPGAPHTHSYTHARSRPASCSPWRATWSSAGSRRAPCASPRSPCATCTCTTTRCAAHALLHTRALASSQLFAVARYMEQRGQPARAMRLATLAMRNLHLHYNQVRRTRTLTHTRARVQPAVRRGALHGAARAAGARHAPRHARHAQPAPALQPGAPHTHSYTHARSRPASCSPWRATWSSAGSRRAPCASPRSPCATCTCTTTRCAAHALLHTRALASSQLFAVARYMEQRGQPARAMRLATLAMRNLHLHYNQVRRTRTLTHTRARVQPAVRRGALHGAARAAGARHAPRHARHAQPAPALQPGAPHTHSYTHARSRPASCSPWRATWSSAGSRRAPCASPRSPCATCTCTTTRCAAHALLHTRALASSQLFAVARYMEQRGQPARAMRLATLAMRNLHLHYNQVRRTRTLTHTRARVQPAVRRGALHGAARAAGARHAPRHDRHAQPAPALQPGAPHTHSYTHARSRPASCSPWRATWSSAGNRRAPCASPRSPCATCTCTTTRCAAHALLHTRALASSQLFAVARYMEQRGQPARAMRLATIAMRNLHLHYNQVRRTRTLTHTRARVQPAVRRGALHGAARATGARHAPRHARHAQPAPALQPGAPHTHSYTHARSRPASCSPWRATWSSAGNRRAPCASPRSPCATCTCTTTRCAAHALLHTRALASSQLFAVARYMEQRGQPARAMRLATLAMRNLHLHYNQVRRTRTLTHTRARVQPAVRRGALHGAARAAGARHAPRHDRHAQPAPALQPGAPHTHSYTHARSRPASCSPWRATWSSAGNRRAPCASPRSPCATCTCTTTRCAAHALLHTRALASSQLFAVARYMEQRGQPARAMRLATLAMRNLHLHYNQVRRTRTLTHTRALASSQLFAVARYMEQRGQPARAMRLATLAMRNLHLHYNQVRRTRTLTHTRARVQPAVRRGALHGAARAAGARHAPRHDRHAQPAPALQPGAPHTHSYTHARSRPASCSPWRATWSSAGNRRAPCASPRSPCATCTCTTTRCAAHALLHTRALASIQLFAVARYMEQRGQPARAMRLATLAMRNLHLHYNQVRRTRTLTHTRALASSQLFAVARYMEQRGQPARAMRLATLAMRNLHLHYNQLFAVARYMEQRGQPARAMRLATLAMRNLHLHYNQVRRTRTLTHTRALASSQLFAVARYMEQRGQPARAMRLATLAMRNLHLHYNQVRRTRTLTHTRARVQPAVRRGALHGAARAAGARHAPRHARHAQPAPALQPGAPHTHSYTHARSRPASCSPWRATWSSAGSRRALCASPRSPCATCTCTTTRCAAHALLHTRALASSQLFAVARYMEQRGQPARAMRLATLAMRNLHLHYNQDSHPAIADIHWAVALAHSLGRAELQAMLPLLVKNVQCAPVLSDVLRRCCVAAAGCSRARPPPPRPPTPLRPLLEAALRAYASTTHARLAHISPRHYADFVDFLGKARDTFALAHDGPHQFAALLQEIKLKYKGKKKLMFLVKERFG
ncbi:unnamed protein product [Euphydryas editha]|uniref:ZSWIM4-8 C-terminal domain-containing protein n=1 Tax=Euphydryas editha TaxID=104508 RepID=A0AAU9TPY9_EUPED|nr:unnamed protein product [Euphydryas editha]